MKQRNFWLTALNVRSYEGNLVKKLFLLQFFQGAGIAFFFTASFALFLSRVPITEMPVVFIYSSIMLWVVGFFYSRIEHKLHISKLAIIITVFMILSMIVFRVAFVYIKTEWFLYSMLAWFNVLYLLNNLEFWGLASVLFDVRQSKRLFGVISAGDIPAKFIGYTLALFTVEYIGTINLLIVGVLCLIASLPFLLSINKTETLPELKHIQKHPSRHTVREVGKIVKDFSVNALIRRLATLSIIITGSFIIINFAFYASVKEAYSDDVSLAKFVALFLAFVRIIALVIKMILTSRLINKLGIIKSLLITPIALLLLVIAMLLTQNMTGYHKIILYLFGVTSIVVDVLRSAIATPVFLTVMQPLPSHERLRAHTIVKGIMDPFASLLAGIILLVMMHYQHTVDLLTISYVLLVICVLWIIGVFRVNSQYLNTLLKTLSNRYFNQENFSITDSGTLAWLKDKVKTGNDTEVINSLSMLFESTSEISEDLVITALNHPSEKVRMAVLKLMQHNQFASAPTLLLPFLKQNNNPAIVAEVIKILCKNGSGDEFVPSYLKNNEQVIRQAALGGLFFFGSGETKKNAASTLRNMIESGNVGERLMVSEILSDLEGFSQSEMILQLMNDSNSKVRSHAFLAAGKSGDEKLLQELLNRIDTNETEIIQSLYVAGEASLPLIEAYISKQKLPKPQREKLILLCGRIGGRKAQDMLLNLLTKHPEEYLISIKALYRSNYSCKPGDQSLLITIAKKLLLRSAGIICMQSSLEPAKEKYQILINSFQLELTSLREGLLYLFAMLYDRENINKVRIAYSTGKKERIINAMEIIDMTIRKDLSQHFNIIFEPGNTSDKMYGLRKIYTVEFFENVERILVRILEEDTRPYNNWTMACSLYTSKKQQHGIDSALIKKYTSAENILLKETAIFAL